MKELEKYLKDLQARGYEQITLSDVLQKIYHIRQDRMIKRHGLDK